MICVRKGLSLGLKLQRSSGLRYLAFDKNQLPGTSVDKVLISVGVVLVEVLAAI